MKKILILVNKTKTNKNTFHKILKEKLTQKAEIDMGFFEDISMDVEQSNVTIYIGDKNISEYDIIYFRRAGAEFLWLAATIAVYLESIGKKYFDSTYKEVGPRGAKLTSLLKLAVRGIPIIPTFFCFKGNILHKADFIIEKFGLPIVVKDLYSQRGRGVFLIKEKDDITRLIEKFPNTKFMFQKFVDKSEEFRVLVLGQTIGCFEKKISSDVTEFRNNVSLGAKEEFLEVSSIPNDIKELSLNSARILKIEIAGVDVVVDTKGKLWLLEVNRGPGLTYDDPKSPEMENIAKYFEEELK